jgi:hypothetical protein
VLSGEFLIAESDDTAWCGATLVGCRRPSSFG